MSNLGSYSITKSYKALQGQQPWLANMFKEFLMIELDDLVACTECGVVVHLRWAKRVKIKDDECNVNLICTCGAILNKDGQN